MSFERRKVRVGKVVSDKMDKSVTVVVEWRRSHRLYKKAVRRQTRFKAHDEQNECRLGDVVRMIETRPLSKTKRWRVAEILSRHEVADIQPEEITAETDESESEAPVEIRAAVEEPVAEAEDTTPPSDETPTAELTEATSVADDAEPADALAEEKPADEAETEEAAPSGDEPTALLADALKESPDTETTNAVAEEQPADSETQQEDDEEKPRQ